jgi:hypothetical protein
MYEVGKTINYMEGSGWTSGVVTAINGDIISLRNVNGVIVEKKTNEILTVLTEEGLSE